MPTIESAHYLIRCRCGAKGVAYWQENDGWRFRRRGPETIVQINGDFDWIEPALSGPASFFGRRLVCKRCGAQPVATEMRLVS
jgi:hypothetical protein